VRCSCITYICILYGEDFISLNMKTIKPTFNLKKTMSMHYIQAITTYPSNLNVAINAIKKSWNKRVDTENLLK
jgi:hypothetical protein